jgi:K+-sensing histidine kinase KdpD
MSTSAAESGQQQHTVTDEPGESSGEQRLRHDLRQSLTLVMMLAAVVDRQPLDSPDIRTSLDQIAHEVGWMARVVKDHSDEGSTSVVDVGGVVAAVWESVARSQQVRLRLVRESGAWVRTDSVALGRSVRNLIENAVRAAGDGTVEVRVIGRDHDVLVEVGDSGPGFGQIPPQQQLGLVTVRRFAARSGGGLQIGTSDLGGALVRLAIPRVPASFRDQQTRTTA